MEEFDVQFKHGSTWQHSYRLGDTLRWGKNDVGTAGAKSTVVEAIGGPCRKCGADGMLFRVLVEDDRIVTVSGGESGP